jgi:hypothetical protein
LDNPPESKVPNTSSAIWRAGIRKFPISRVKSRGGEEAAKAKKDDSAFQVFVLVTLNEARMRLCSSLQDHPRLKLAHLAPGPICSFFATQEGRSCKLPPHHHRICKLTEQLSGYTQLLFAIG